MYIKWPASEVPVSPLHSWLIITFPYYHSHLGCVYFLFSGLPISHTFRNKRLADVQQFNMDRVVDFMFGADDTAFHVILELYAGGNIILTDHEYRIMNLLRTHQYDESVKVAVREIYPITYAAGTDSRSYLGSEDSVKSQSEALVLFLKGVNGSGGASGDDDGAVEKGGKAAPAPATKAPTLKAALGWAASPVGNISPTLIDHALYAAKIKGSTKVKPGWAGLSTEEVAAFFTSLREIIVKVEDLKSGGITPGYITLEKPKEKTGKASKKSAKKGDDEDDEGDDSLAALASADGGPIFSGFNPLIFPHMVSDGEEVIEFASFADAVDEYFSKWEQQRAMRDVQKAKSQATKKVDKLKEDQERRLGQLSDTITVAKAKVDGGIQVFCTRISFVWSHWIRTFTTTLTDIAIHLTSLSPPHLPGIRD